MKGNSSQSREGQVLRNILNSEPQLVITQSSQLRGKLSSSYGGGGSPCLLSSVPASPPLRVTSRSLVHKGSTPRLNDIGSKQIPLPSPPCSHY